MSVVDDSLDHPMKLEERAAMPLAGGIMGNGYQCGMLWGAALSAGAQAYRLFGPGPQAETEAILAAQRLVEAYRARNKHINCAEITEINWGGSSDRGMAAQVLKFFLKGGPILCFSMTANYARIAFSEINTAFSGSLDSKEHNESPSSPVGCAAILAQKMGLSDLHTVMAAGFAGGIGLSGGACGALGAAIWIIGMENPEGGGGNLGFENPKAMEVMDRFLKSADYEFECSEIVGRKFENVADHVAFLQAGGCSKIIEALAKP